MQSVSHTCTAQLRVICQCAEDALDPTVCVVDGDIESTGPMSQWRCGWGHHPTPHPRPCSTSLRGCEAPAASPSLGAPGTVQLETQPCQPKTWERPRPTPEEPSRVPTAPSCLWPCWGWKGGLRAGTRLCCRRPSDGQGERAGTDAQKFQLNVAELLCCAVIEPGAGGPERGWSLPLWGYCRPIQTQSCTMCSGMALQEQEGTELQHRTPPRHWCLQRQEMTGFSHQFISCVKPLHMASRRDLPRDIPSGQDEGDKPINLSPPNCRLNSHPLALGRSHLKYCGCFGPLTTRQSSRHWRAVENCPS
ncbi:uncharacterized protein LOC128799088 [Vidua chalybeata]|uniref:uncharacterized protein LOC128799088 n=1 Tax=Vidua chalybeata TaxID=81927 RepID=UPI0023A81973|nr:uncharacterized protein LOC128799088 [Vidua chalybeata]